MVITTRAQREMLKYKWQMLGGPGFMPYRAYRKEVRGTFGMDDAIVVPWANMWLVIETDGYAHT
jgi:hypothetical protein